MTNKVKYIKAIKELIEIKYKQLQDITCPLCEVSSTIRNIYKSLDMDKDHKHCTFCPNKTKSLFTCINHKTFTYHISDMPNHLKARLEYWKRYLPILEAKDSKHFTKKGNTVDSFKELIEIDKQVAKEFKL